MIDEYNTYLKFGYKSTDLKKYSLKKIIVICNNCNESRESTMSAASSSKNGHCIKCQRILQAKKIARENRIGRKHTEKSKQKARESHLLLGLRGEKSPNFNKKKPLGFGEKVSENNRKRVWKQESRDKASKSHTGKIMSQVSKDKMSESRMGEKNNRFGKPAAHGKGQYYTRKNGNKIWVRSSWEFKIAEYLDNNNYNWEFEHFAYIIDYNHNGITKKGTYRPDFKVWKDNENDYEIWEIKGYWRDDAKSKFTAFLERYSKELNIKLLQKEELISLGIILKK